MPGDDNRMSNLSNADGRGTLGDDGSPGARPPTAGQMSMAFGRTPEDIATDQPAGKAGFGAGESDGNLPGSDDRTGGWGPTKVDPDTGGDIRRGRRRELHPEVDPDTRLGLQPTVGEADLPNPSPAAATAEPENRAATGALAGVVADGLVVVLLYLLMAAGQTGAATFLAAEQHLFGVHGWIDHVIGIVGALIAAGVFGALFALLFARPSVVLGMLFALLPQALLWLVLSPMLGMGLFYGGSTGAIILPLIFNVLIWGGLLGRQSNRWLQPPYTTAVTPEQI